MTGSAHVHSRRPSTKPTHTWAGFRDSIRFPSINGQMTKTSPSPPEVLLLVHKTSGWGRRVCCSSTFLQGRSGVLHPREMCPHMAGYTQDNQRLSNSSQCHLSEITKRLPTPVYEKAQILPTHFDTLCPSLFPISLTASTAAGNSCHLPDKAKERKHRQSHHH